MNFFSSAIAGLGTAAWSRATLPSQASVGIPNTPTVTLPGGAPVGLYPDMGIPNVQIPDLGSVTIPNMGNVSMPLQGVINGQITQTPNLGNWWGTCGPTTGWGTNVGRITGSLTGISCGGVHHHRCHNTFSTQNLQMPSWARNPFPSSGTPNAFFTAQLYGGGSGFYSAFSNAFSGFRFA